MKQYHTVNLLNNHYGVIADCSEPGIDFKIVLQSSDINHVTRLAKNLNDTEELRTLGIPNNEPAIKEKGLK